MDWELELCSSARVELRVTLEYADDSIAITLDGDLDVQSIEWPADA